MRTEKLLDAIGNIDDQLIDDASPLNHISKKQTNLVKWGSLAACFCVILIGIWGFSTLIFPSNGFDSMMAEADASDKYATTEDMIAGESTIEEEIMEGPAQAEGIPEETLVKAELPAEEPASAENPGGGNDSKPYTNIAYGFILNDIEYFPISFEERKQFGLVPENDAGLTSENTYQITETDLGEFMGTIAVGSSEDLIGATVYHFAKFPQDDTICIVAYEGNYEFYTGRNVGTDNKQ